MKKSVYFLLIALLAMFSSRCYALNGDLGLSTDPSVNGSSDHRWLIEDFADFEAFCNDSSKWAAAEHVRLEVDLDLDPTLPGRQIYPKAPISGDNDSATIHLQGSGYYGYFDGNGHTISNLTISGHDYCGLFGVTFPGANISNLGVINVNILCADSSTCLGGLVGQNSGTISKCYSTGLIKGTSVSHLTATAYIGGLVGWNESGSISNSYSTTTVIGGTYLGGLAGIHNGGVIDNCYSSGPISSWYYSYPFVGGMIAVFNGGTVTNSVWNIESSGLTGSAAGNPATDAQMKEMNIFLNAGWDLDYIDGDIADWYMGNEGYPVLNYRDSLPGNGTEVNPYKINDLIDFVIFGYPDRAGSYWASGVYTRLEVDLDLTGLSYTKAPIAPDTDDTMNGFQGIEYAGHFDGNHHTIGNLSIIGHKYCGLFGIISATGHVSDLSVGNASIAGGDSSGYLGCLAGQSYGNIYNCQSSGLVQGGIMSMIVGGLIGDNYYGTIVNSASICSVTSGRESTSAGGLLGTSFMGSISNCYSTGPVSAGIESKFIGGLVGVTFKDMIRNSYSTGRVKGDLRSSTLGGLVGINLYGDIENCYSTADVSGGESTYLGGLVGVNNGNESVIRNCYAKGSVSSGLSGSYLGGLVGENDEGKIEFCYSTGSIYAGALGASYIGGVLGNNAGIVLSCFWDVNTSGFGAAGDNNYAAIGKTTAQMQDEKTFLDASWDFNAEIDHGTDDIWHMPYQATGYPMLYWQRDIPGDLTGGYGVDMVDFSALSESWVDAGGTDFDDLAALAQNWLAGK